MGQAFRWIRYIMMFTVLNNSGVQVAQVQHKDKQNGVNNAIISYIYWTQGCKIAVLKLSSPRTTHLVLNI